MPKQLRQFQVDEATGEVRCGDRSCEVTQCGQCNKEQNRRNRAAIKERNDQRAREQKLKEDEQRCNDERAAQDAGRVYNWTYDETGDQEASYDAWGADEDAVVFESVIVGGAAVQHKESDSGMESDAKKASKTTWNHMTRMLLYNCISKFNPFAAPVKKDAWNKIAEEMGRATAGLNDAQRGDFRVKTDGHGLEVYYGRRMLDMSKNLSKEETSSGQAGYAVSKEQRDEFAVLASCSAKEKDAALQKQKKRTSKKALDDLRNNEVTGAVKQAALEDGKVRKRQFQVLQTKVRAAKLEASVWEKSQGGLGKYNYSAQQLDDIATLNELDKEFGSDAADADKHETETSKGKGGIVAKAIADIARKLPDALHFTSLDPTEFAKSWHAAKQEHAMKQQNIIGVLPRKRSLKERLQDVDDQRALGLITESEVDKFKTEVKKSYFLSQE
jgi:hypothetical protein